MHIVPALQRPRQEDGDFEASLGYIISLSLNNNNNNYDIKSISYQGKV
jgi:hypothetical protein